MEENRTLAQIKPSVLQNVPVKNDFNSDLVLKIEKLTYEIIGNINLNIAYVYLTEQIDKLVYQLYDLTEEEIKIIEGT